jgi:uncharacterized protein
LHQRAADLCAQATGLAKLPAFHQEESTFGMFRLLFWIVVIFAAIWLWRRFKTPSTPRSQPRQQDETQPMVRCAQCGVHVPRNHALSQDDRWYCSRAHLEQDQGSGER